MFEITDQKALELANHILSPLMRGVVSPETVHPDVVAKLHVAMEQQQMKKPFAIEADKDGRLPKGVLQRFLNK